MKTRRLNFFVETTNGFQQSAIGAVTNELFVGCARIIGEQPSPATNLMQGGAPVARESHKLSVVGSIPTPATNLSATSSDNTIPNQTDPAPDRLTPFGKLRLKGESESSFVRGDLVAGNSLPIPEHDQFLESAARPSVPATSGTAPAVSPRFFVLQVCAVCQSQYGRKPCDPERDGLISHGLCTICSAFAHTECLELKDVQADCHKEEIAC